MQPFALYSHAKNSKIIRTVLKKNLNFFTPILDYLRIKNFPNFCSVIFALLWYLHTRAKFSNQHGQSKWTLSGKRSSKISTTWLPYLQTSLFCKRDIYQHNNLERVTHLSILFTLLPPSIPDSTPPSIPLRGRWDNQNQLFFRSLSFYITRKVIEPPLEFRAILLKFSTNSWEQGFIWSTSMSFGFSKDSVITIKADTGDIVKDVYMNKCQKRATWPIILINDDKFNYHNKDQKKVTVQLSLSRRCSSQPTTNSGQRFFLLIRIGIWRRRCWSHFSNMIKSTLIPDVYGMSISSPRAHSVKRWPEKYINLFYLSLLVVFLHITLYIMLNTSFFLCLRFIKHLTFNVHQ